MPPAVAQNTSSSGPTVSTPRPGVATRHALDRVAERAVPELAVDVGGDRAADGHVTRAGHRPSGTSRAAGTPASASRCSRRPRPCRFPSRRRARGCGRAACSGRRRRRRSARRRRSCGRAHGRRSRGRRRRPVSIRPRDVVGAPRLPHVGAGRRGATPAGEHLAVRAVDRVLSADMNRDREATRPTRGRCPSRTRSESTSSSGAPPSPWVSKQRVTQDAEGERHDRELEPRPARRPAPTSRTPTGSTRGSRRSTRRRARSSGTPRCNRRANAGG